MNVEEKIQAVLQADAGVIALVAAARIRMPGDWEDLQPPYILHKPVTVSPTHTQNALANLKTWRYQVDCFGAKYSLAKAVAVAVRAALGSYSRGGIQSMWIGEGPAFYQQDINVHQIPVEFEVFDCLP